MYLALLSQLTVSVLLFLFFKNMYYAWFVFEAISSAPVSFAKDSDLKQTKEDYVAHPQLLM